MNFLEQQLAEFLKLDQQQDWLVNREIAKLNKDYEGLLAGLADLNGRPIPTYRVTAVGELSLKLKKLNDEYGELRKKMDAISDRVRPYFEAVKNQPVLYRETLEHPNSK
jgi:hypothetical protein